ncbi:hypothetical protein RRG08_004880 [Elysia crispata]|uniref:Uncharacterized protein n=1 Tax=Elysia crispata TaxID=231223 RepID=A0AAE0ZHM6_9GAST|nr:hypothetical protein RRG08_004880 [Elysia crispata]
MLTRRQAKSPVSGVAAKTFLRRPALVSPLLSPPQADVWGFNSSASSLNNVMSFARAYWVCATIQLWTWP